MIGIFKLLMGFGFTLVLGACATAIPVVYMEPNAGFANVSSQTSATIGKRATFAQTQAENIMLKKQVHTLVYQKTISADNKPSSSESSIIKKLNSDK